MHVSLGRPVKTPSLVGYRNDDFMEVGLVACDPDRQTVGQADIYNWMLLLLPERTSPANMLDKYLAHQSREQERKIEPVSLLVVEEGTPNDRAPRWASRWAKSRGIRAHSRPLLDCDAAAVSRQVQKSHSLGLDLEMTYPDRDVYLYVDLDKRRVYWVDGKGMFTPVKGTNLQRQANASQIGTFAGRLVMDRARELVSQGMAMRRAVDSTTGVVIVGSNVRSLPKAENQRYREQARDALRAVIEPDSGLSSFSLGVISLPYQDTMRGLAALAA